MARDRKWLEDAYRRREEGRELWKADDDAPRVGFSAESTPDP